MNHDPRYMWQRWFKNPGRIFHDEVIGSPGNRYDGHLQICGHAECTILKSLHARGMRWYSTFRINGHAFATSDRLICLLQCGKGLAVVLAVNRNVHGLEKRSKQWPFQ